MKMEMKEIILLKIKLRKIIELVFWDILGSKLIKIYYNGNLYILNNKLLSFKLLLIIKIIII